jgi:hypothetical protein
MWGKIMNVKLRTLSLKHSLIAYNAGGAGLNRFLRGGNDQDTHKYIKGIKVRLDDVGL